MNVNQLIEETLSQFGFPCATNIYTGEKHTYFVMTVNSLPADMADDEPGHIRNLVSLHLFCPNTTNTNRLRKRVKKALLLNGFTYPTETDASDKESQHVVFEFENAEGISWEDA